MPPTQKEQIAKLDTNTKGINEKVASQNLETNNLKLDADEKPILVLALQALAEVRKASVSELENRENTQKMFRRLLMHDCKNSDCRRFSRKTTERDNISIYS